MHHQVLEAWLDGLTGRIHGMFIIAHDVGYYNYRDLAQVLYLYLDLSHLSPFVMDVIAFFLKTYRESRYQFQEFVIPCHASHEVSLPVIEPLKDLGTEEDHSLTW